MMGARSSNKPRLAISAASAALALAAGSARGQCDTPTWLPGDGVAGTNLYVACSTTWDPDGPGPITPKVVIGGRFDVAGDAIAANIGMWDPDTGEWFALGSGMSGSATVRALAVHNGLLIAGGEFLDAGGVPVNNIAAYDGTNWTALGEGVTGAEVALEGVHTLAIATNGDLIAGGDFLAAGSALAHGVARWNGSAWSALGSGVGGDLGYPPVTAVAVLPNGNIVLAGNFTTAGGSPRSNIARWDGSAWQDMAGGIDFGVNTLGVGPNGNLIAAGYFSTAGGSPAGRVARWNSTASSQGTAWSTLGAGLETYNDEFYGNAVTVLPNGDVVVAGNSYIRESTTPHANGIARWNGSAWSTFAGGLRDAYDNGVFGQTLLRLPNGDLIVGGQFNRAGGPSGVGAANIARWNGTSWTALNDGFNDWLITAKPLANGDVLACGAFSTAGPGPTPGAIARWNGTAWTAVGSPGLAGFVSDALELDDGSLLVGGGFWLPGQDPTVDPQNAMAIFDGTTWTTDGVYTPDAYVYTIAKLPNGHIAVGGVFLEVSGVPALNVAIYDGSQWNEPDGGVGAPGDAVIFLTALPNNQLIASGYFTQAGGAAAANIATYNSATGWSALGDGTDATVYATAAAPNGDIFAAGVFTTPAAGIARWNGSAWSALGAGIDNAGGGYALAVAPNGDIYLGGQFTSVDSTPASNIAKWNGSTWAALGSGVDGGFSDYSVVYGLNFRANGQLMAAGQFNRAGGITSVNFARYGCDNCPSDFNADGFVTGDDFDGYVAAFELGDIAADFNHDGFVTGDDFDAYVLAFEAGC